MDRDQREAKLSRLGQILQVHVELDGALKIGFFNKPSNMAHTSCHRGFDGDTMVESRTSKM